MKTNRQPIDRRRTAFSLMEVMIAVMIFFACVFTILGVITNGLRNARVLQRKIPDSGMIASEITMSNALMEQVENGEFGDLYAGYSWTRETYEVASNKLFQVNIGVVKADGEGRGASVMSILLFRPNSPPGSMDGAMKGQ